MSTIPTTTVSPTTLTLQSVKGPHMVENPENEVTVRDYNFNMVSKPNVFSSCKVCNKKLNDIETAHHTLKCQNCGTRQRTSDIKLQASAKLAIVYIKELWLQVFHDQLLALLENSNVSLTSTTDDIEDHLLALQNIQFKYNVHSNKIIKVITWKKSESVLDLQHWTHKSLLH